ncbi:ankyrin repeat domain-containing protein SOWAHA [Pelobates fuscus]|uniref:ankyrin repeat domain-containing protein SOWAHA n=1 Tax=Pelobates fuscus TaxID=191477 RepID=UPI002FE4B27D
MAVSQEVVLNFLLEQGGSVRNSDLLRRFKSVVDVSDPQQKASNREAFKRFVNNIAVVKDVEGVKVVVLRKRFSHLLKEKEQVVSGEREPRNASGQFLPASEGDFNQNEIRDIVPSSQRRSSSQLDLAGDQDNLQVEGKLRDIVILPKGEDVDDDGGSSVGLAYAPSNSTEEKGSISSDEIEDNENKRISVIDIASRIETTGPAPVPKQWASGEINKGPAQKPFMLPLRYAPQSFDGTEDQEENISKPPSFENILADGLVHPVQPRSPHISRRILDDTGSKSPHTKRSSKLAKVNEENKYSDVVPLDSSEHAWLVSSTGGRWNHILLGLLINDYELAEKRDFICGFTALHWAVKSGNTEMIKILFEMARKGGLNLNVNVKSFGGYTPLHIAAIHDHKEVIIMLVRDYNAKVHIRDHSGRKPYQYLKQGSSMKVMCLLNDPRALNTEQTFTTKRNSKVATSLLGTTSALLGVLSDDIPFHDLAKGLKKPVSFNKFFTAPTGQKKKLKPRGSCPSIASLTEEVEEEVTEPVGKRRPTSDFFS